MSSSDSTPGPLPPTLSKIRASRNPTRDKFKIAHFSPWQLALPGCSTPIELTVSTLIRLSRELSPEAWQARVDRAEAKAEQLSRSKALMEAGASRTSALQQVLPDRPVASLLPRLRRYLAGGAEALIEQRPMLNTRKISPEVRHLVRGMLTANPELRSHEVQALLVRQGPALSEASVRRCLSELGLSQPVGRPGGPMKPKPLPMAGAELLKALDLELGAVAALTHAVDAHLSGLPEPTGEPLDDSAHRDELGRFLPSYNAPTSRTWEEQGGKFDSVQRHRAEKDLRAMRVGTSSHEARRRKDMASTLLPLLVGGPRSSELRHGYGAQLDTLVGHPYQPSTLDKHALVLRIAKFSGASNPMREAVAAFWLASEGVVTDPLTGAALVYMDATTKPIWTHTFACCAKVSGNGRVMPAISTVTLHSGAGTPLVYWAFSGQVSVPAEVPTLLREYEQAGGEGMARRVVVIDREARAVWLFKELADAGWTWIVPLRSNVIGPKARFEEEQAPEPYTHSGASDEVIDSFLWLNDSRPGEAPLRVRAVGRRRARTGKISWFATNAPSEEFSPSEIVRLYFDRWPLQEQVYRDGKGAVGLNAHHGYGKQKVVDVAIVDKLEALDGKLRRREAEHRVCQQQAEKLRSKLVDQAGAIARVEALCKAHRQAIDAELEAGRAGDRRFATCLPELAGMGGLAAPGDPHPGRVGEHAGEGGEEGRDPGGAAGQQRLERVRLEERREIFTVDVDLDEIIAAYKLTFLNLSLRLMHDRLGEMMEIDMLISAVLRLPGEQLLTAKEERVRIYRQARDPGVMETVERASATLTAKGQRRDGRWLRFEWVDAPAG